MSHRVISIGAGVVFGAIGFGRLVHVHLIAGLSGQIEISRLIWFLTPFGALYGAACGWAAERIQEAVRPRWAIVARSLFWIIAWVSLGLYLLPFIAVGGFFVMAWYAWGVAILFYAFVLAPTLFWAPLAGGVSGGLIWLLDRRRLRGAIPPDTSPRLWWQFVAVLAMAGAFSPLLYGAAYVEEEPGEISALAFSPEGHLAVSGSTDGFLILWDVERGGEVRRFDRLNRILCVAFSPDGQSLLAMDGKQSLGVWSVAAGRLIRRRDGAKQLAGCAFSSDRRLLALMAFDPQEGAALLDVGSGAVISHLPALRKSIASDAGIAFSPDGRVLLAAEGAGLRLVDVATGAEVRSFGAEYQYTETVAFSPDGRLAISNGGSAAHVWDVETGEEIGRVRSNAKWVGPVAFSPDGRLALTGSADGILRVWDVHAGKRLLRVVAPPGPIRSVAFSPDGRQILSGHGEGALFLWDAASGERIRTVRAPLVKGRTAAASRGQPVTSPADQAPHDSVNAIVFSSDGRRMLSGGLGGTARLWDVLEGSETRRVDLDCGEILSPAFVPDGRRALAGCRDGSAVSFDLETGEDVRTFPAIEPAGTVAFSADGSRALTRGDDGGSVRVWALETGKQLRRFDFRGARKVAFSADGRRLLTYGNDLALRLWDVETGQEIRRLATKDIWEVSRVQFSPDGRLGLAEGFSFHDQADVVVFVNVETGREVRRLKMNHAYRGDLTVLGDGNRLLFYNSEGLHVWDAVSGKEVRSFGKHVGAITRVALSPDGRLAASGGPDGAVRLWDVERGQEVRRFGGEVPHGPNP